MPREAAFMAKESTTAILVAATLQFINIMDFMMVMPLGPDFAKALDMPLSDIGKIGGAYTLAAAVVGLLAACFIDRFARKPAILFCLGGLICATFLGAFAWNENTMLLTRLLAGAFGGPLTSLSLALVADMTTPEKRGAAMGKVMSGFAVASVFGVPFGLQLAQSLSWRAPFMSTAMMGAVVWIFAASKLPFYASLAMSYTPAQHLSRLSKMLRSGLALMAYAMLSLTMLAGFMIIPNISTHVQVNLGYPRSQVGLLYLLGGSLSFVGMFLAGKLADRTSTTFTISLFTLLLVAVLLAGFVFYSSTTPVTVIFPLFMVSMTGRMVCAQTLSSRIPKPDERGAYMSVQSSCIQFSSALGGFYSSKILVPEEGHLMNVPTVALTAIFFSLIIPVICWRIEKALGSKNFSHGLSAPLEV